MINFLASRMSVWHMFTAMSTLVTTRLDAFIVDAFTSGEAPYPEAFATNAFVGEVVEGSVGISAHAYSRSERVNAGDGHCPATAPAY